MFQERNELVTIKGIRDGLLLTSSANNYEQLRSGLEDELTGKRGFLQGSQVALSLGELVLTRHQISQLQSWLAEQELTLWTILAEDERTKEAARQLGLATRLPGSNTDLAGNILAQPETAVTSETTSQPPPGGLLLRETVRSGRSIYHEGHIVIIGDVNAGAEVIAGGDVIIWGKLRGLVHAGALGDHSAVICALALIPTQLRISDQIAIAPNERQQDTVPEKAFIRDGQIVAEAWTR